MDGFTKDDRHKFHFRFLFLPSAPPILLLMTINISTLSEWNLQYFIDHFPLQKPFSCAGQLSEREDKMDVIPFHLIGTHQSTEPLHTPSVQLNEFRELGEALIKFIGPHFSFALRCFPIRFIECRWFVG